MQEPTQQANEPFEASEVETLRKTNAELVQKNATRKSKIAELEEAVSQLQAKLSDATATIKRISVEVPLRQIAEKVSDVPDFWLKTFGEAFKVEADEGGKLAVFTANGEPAKNSKGEPVNFDFLSLSRFVTEYEPDSERTKLFRRITATTFASGAMSTSAQGRAMVPRKQSRHEFGLR